jgi:hypothetical protein
MRRNYDFSKAKRGPIVAPAPGKERITIRLDREILDWFRARVERAGGGSYQSRINQALRNYIASVDQDLETTLRRVLREELAGRVRKEKQPR